jgi:hypothetical protein
MLRRLIVKGNVDQLAMAERAIKKFVEATPEESVQSGLRLIQKELSQQRPGLVGDQRNFADIVNIYIENKLAGLPAKHAQVLRSVGLTIAVRCKTVGHDALLRSIGQPRRVKR